MANKISSGAGKRRGSSVSQPQRRPMKSAVRSKAIAAKRPAQKSVVKKKFLVPSTPSSDSYYGTAKEAARVSALLKKKAAYEKSPAYLKGNAS